MKVEWQHKVLGRKQGDVEDIDEKKEPRLKSWLASGMVTKPKAVKFKPAKDEEG